MDPCHGQSSFVFDISSDDEGCRLFEDEPVFTGSDDSDWLAELFREESATPSGGDSDEVVVVKEVNPKSKSKGPQLVVDDDDDDCVILDSDPDKPVAVSDGSAVASSSDDLQIVGETGQIACRDYPHSRHLCVKFPFSTVSHEAHCNLCHCYVCDLPAPCMYWGSGVFSTDHCHATDKEEVWRVQRKQSKGEKTSLAPSPKLHDGSNRAAPQLTPVPVPLGPAHIVANGIPNNSIRMLNPCSTSVTSRFSTGNASARNNPISHLVNGVISQRFRAHKNGSQLMPHSVASARAFKRVGLSSSQRTSQHSWSPLHNNWNSVYVPKDPTSRQSVLPCARPTPYINRASSPPTYPVTADATCGWSNDLTQSLQQLIPAQALGGNGGQFQTCQSESVNEPNSQSTGTCSPTAAEIESWLLEDMPHQDTEGTFPFDIEKFLDECDSNM